MSVENSASTILQRGVALDNQKRYTESLICYQEGLQLLVDLMKKGDVDVAKKKYLRTKIEGYMERAEQIKSLIAQQKDAGLFHEQIHIESNSTGHTYKALFGRFLDEDVISVAVEDPYVRSNHQCQNFLRLCELLVQSCKNLKRIDLTTSIEKRSNMEHSSSAQNKMVECLTADLLENYNVTLYVHFSDTLHDRQITLSSGWIIKIGRGLDIYKATKNYFCLGACDFNLRQCHETTVDIFHNKDVKHIS